ERASDVAVGGHIPQLDLAIGAAAGQGVAVRAEYHRPGRDGVAAGVVADLVAGGHVPQSHRSSLVTAGQGLAVRAEAVAQAPVWPVGNPGLVDGEGIPDRVAVAGTAKEIKADHAHPDGVKLALLLTWRSRANPLVRRARHVSCPLRACHGLSCRCTQALDNVDEVSDVPQTDGLIGAAAGQGLAVR